LLPACLFDNPPKASHIRAMTTQIGIDYTSAIHQSAGIGRYTRELVQVLAAEWPAAQYRLFVANARRAALPPLPGQNFSWQPTRLSERWLARLWYRLRLPLAINRWTGPLHLFHAPDFFLPPVDAATRTIVTVHDLSFVRHPESVMPGMSQHLNTWVPRSVQRADHVIAVSEATRQDLMELYHTPPGKISVLYHGVTPEFAPVTSAARLNDVRQKYNLGQNPFILSVGTLQPRKNYQRLIQALAQLEADVSLVIVGGRGWQVEPILAEIERQKLAARVHLPGFVADADLPALYSAAALFVYPSLYEGFGLPVLEAMACGAPVIAANRSALPEVVGNAGLLIDPYNVDELAAAINRLLGDGSLRAQLATAGRAQAAQFTWPAMARQLVEMYRQIIQR